MLENEILLIGIGTNKAELHRIIEAESALFVENIYGSRSCFAKAFREIRAFSDSKISVLNIESWEDMKDHDVELNDYPYDYVVPLDLELGESYLDDFYGIRMLYSQLLLMLLSNTISTIVVTGKHASEFEDLDSYLNYENDVIGKGKNVFKNLRKENMIYVGNGLKNYRYANAVLAAVLSASDYDAYPESSLFGEAYFDIDYADVENELVYYRNNSLVNTSIENLINFSNDPILRLVPVYRIIKYFYCHHADVDKYIGMAFTEYRRMKILEAEEKFFKSCVGWIIYKYEILSITAVKGQDGTVSVLLSVDIWPKFTTEKYNLEIHL